MDVIELQVIGRVGGSGSKSAYPVKKANGSTGVAIAPASKFQKPWMDSVRWAFLQTYSRHFMPFRGAIMFQAVFYLPRPKGHYKKDGKLSKEGQRHPYPDKRSAPDLDKATRSTKDALSGFAYKDDKQVVCNNVAWEWRTIAGAEIRIEQIFDPSTV